MATIHEKLAESLAVLKAYQDAHGDNLVIQGADTGVYVGFGAGERGGEY